MFKRQQGQGSMCLSQWPLGDTPRTCGPGVPLGQHSDPTRVLELLHETGKVDLERKKTELVRSEKQLGKLDADFLQNLDLLKKKMLSEEEFSSANSRRRDKRAKTEMRLAVLREEVNCAESAHESASSLPGKVKSFLESFQQLETPKAKAMLQMILKAAYVWTDGRVELVVR